MKINAMLREADVAGGDRRKLNAQKVPTIHGMN